MKYPCLFFTKKFLSFGSKNDKPVFSDDNVFIKRKINSNKYLFKLGSSDAWDVLYILDGIGILYKVNYIKYNYKNLSFLSSIINFSTAEVELKKVTIDSAGDMRSVLKDWYSGSDRKFSFPTHFMSSLQKMPQDQPFDLNCFCKYIPGLGAEPEES